jgi:hypothetical protein
MPDFAHNAQGGHVLYKRDNEDVYAEILPVASAEDVEFTEELADEEDREAQRRADEADRRAANYKGG